jgi:hypothetical protein
MKKKVNFHNSKIELFKRKGKKCELCKSENFIEVHHKDQNCSNNEIKNLKVLCRDCHDQEHRNLGFGKGSRLVLELEDDLHALIKIKAAQEKKSMRKILTDLVKKWLKRN